MSICETPLLANNSVFRTVQQGIANQTVQIPANSGKNYTISIPLTSIEDLSKCIFNHSLDATLSFPEYGEITNFTVVLTETEIVISFYGAGSHPSYLNQNVTIKGDWRVLEFY